MPDTEKNQAMEGTLRVWQMTYKALNRIVEILLARNSRVLAVGCRQQMASRRGLALEGWQRVSCNGKPVLHAF